MSALIPPGCAVIQRGERFHPSHHTLGWNARRDFYDCHRGDDGNGTTDEHRFTQMKEGKYEAID
jgi:hypothetical protein